jgi:hypothetical protein
MGAGAFFLGALLSALLAVVVYQNFVLPAAIQSALLSSAKSGDLSTLLGSRVGEESQEHATPFLGGLVRALHVFDANGTDFGELVSVNQVPDMQHSSASTTRLFTVWNYKMNCLVSLAAGHSEYSRRVSHNPNGETSIFAPLPFHQDVNNREPSFHRTYVLAFESDNCSGTPFFDVAVRSAVNGIPELTAPRDLVTGFCYSAHYNLKDDANLFVKLEDAPDLCK